MTASLRLGLFGGRFDPVHRAHIQIAQAVADQLNLDEIRWIVTGTPVHKPAIASAKHRLAMTQLALEELNDSRMRIDDREIIAASVGKTNYTADTVASFEAELPNRHLVWILGEDQLEDFQTWSRWQWLIQHVTLAVCARPGAHSSGIAKAIADQGGQITWIHLQPDEVSSTRIRQAIQSKNLEPGLMPRSVSQYIHEHKLYL